MSDEFLFDVFLSHSSKDKSIVRPLAERLRKDGVKVWFDEWVLKPGDSIPAKIEEGLERSRVLVLCMSANAFGSDWAQLESGTFRFRDPLNKERRFLPLSLDDAPIKGSLAQFLYINWRLTNREEEYAKLLEACCPPLVSPLEERSVAGQRKADGVIRLGSKAKSINAYAFSPDGMRVIAADSENLLAVWDATSGKRIGVLGTSPMSITRIEWSADKRRAISSGSNPVVHLWNMVAGWSIGLLGDTNNRRWSQTASEWRESSEALTSGDIDGRVRVWETGKGDLMRTLLGHHGRVWDTMLSVDKRHVLSGGEDRTACYWDIQKGKRLQVFEGHTQAIKCVALSQNQELALSGSDDHTLRLWHVRTGLCIRIFEGHSDDIRSVAFSADQCYAVSASSDKSIRVWDVETGICLQILVGHLHEIVTVAWTKGPYRLLSADRGGYIHIWNLSNILKPLKKTEGADQPSSSAPDQVQYTNAKVLLVGETHAGKTGLTHRLATGIWKPSEDSTVGAWSTQVKLDFNSAESDVDREIWLWDFGGQADQRLIHQLYMDRTALILLLFNADQDDVLPGLRDWQTALRRSVKDEIPYFLVAGRIDTGFKASRGKLQAFAKEQRLAYHETSAKAGDGCDELRAAMIVSIPWEQMEKRTSPRIFKLIKDEILKLRDEGQVLHTFKELRELLWRRIPDEPRFNDETLQTVIGLLDGPGVVKELDYGTYILLSPEWINAYAQAVIRTLRSAENDLGVLPLRSIAEGKLVYQSIGRDGIPVQMKRLPPAEERVVLGEMERQLEQRGLCLRQGDKLVFPSHCGRDRPAVLEHPTVFVSYAVKGFLDDIYATLVVKLADSESFQLKELWRDAADFVTLAGDNHMGLKLRRASGSDGDISVYFGKGVTQQEQVIFANYIHAHLEASCEQAQRLRHYVCPKCHSPKGNAEVLMKKLLRDKQNADTECDDCGERFALWDALEKKFASREVRYQVELLKGESVIRLDTRRKGKLLALEVGARITSADQKCFEIPATEDEGLDMELEFTNDDGEGTGRRLYLQLKSGNSYLKKRRTDGAEIFTIKKQRWVQYWLQQPHPVMLVIGNFSDDDDRTIGKDKLEFTDVRWMEITSVLRRESANGTKPVKQIEFKGERLDLSSVRRWREKVLASS